MEQAHDTKQVAVGQVRWVDGRGNLANTDVAKVTATGLTEAHRRRVVKYSRRDGKECKWKLKYISECRSCFCYEMADDLEAHFRSKTHFVMINVTQYAVMSVTSK